MRITNYYELQICVLKKIISILFLFVNIHFSYSQKNADSIRAEQEKFIKEATMDKYIVIAGTSTDYTYLENQSKKISKNTGIVFDNQDMVYDKKRGMIVPDTSSDEIYAGGYYPRRYCDERISIEMMWYYTDEQNNDTLKDMIIITGIFGNKEDAQKQLEKVKAAIPTAYIKKKGIYMGCMH